MSRNKKIDIDSSSFKLMVQETYNDILHQKNEATRLFKEIKQNADLGSEGGIEDIPIVGPTLVNLLKVIDQTVDKKIQLLKIFHTYIKSGLDEKSTDGGNGGTGSLIPTGNNRKALEELLSEMQGNKTLNDGKSTGRNTG